PRTNQSAQQEPAGLTERELDSRLSAASCSKPGAAPTTNPPAEHLRIEHASPHFAVGLDLHPDPVMTRLWELVRERNWQPAQFGARRLAEILHHLGRDAPRR